MTSATYVLLSGALAATCVDLVVYPLDTIKTRFQSPDYRKIYYDASKNAVNRRVLFRGLYQGVGPIILITIPSSGAFFTTYESLKNVLTKANSRLNNTALPQPFVHSAASGLAELFSCFILTPAEVLKQNAQMIRQPAKSSTSKGSSFLEPSVSLQVLKLFIKRPTKLWRGYTALAGRNLPFTAMQFPMFEHMKTTIKAYREKTSRYTGSLTETGLITALSAGSAGSVAAVVTTPIDVIKTRIMLSAAGESSEKDSLRVQEAIRKSQHVSDDLSKRKVTSRKSGFAVAKEVVGESGVIKGLFRGGTLRAVWTALGSGLYLSTYEAGKQFLGERRGMEELS